MDSLNLYLPMKTAKFTDDDDDGSLRRSKILTVSVNVNLSSIKSQRNGSFSMKNLSQNVKLKKKITTIMLLKISKNLTKANGIQK